MDETEVRGRWKSFTGKWNRGELAEGWYDPEMFARVTEEWVAEGGSGRRGKGDVDEEDEEEGGEEEAPAAAASLGVRQRDDDDHDRGHDHSSRHPPRHEDDSDSDSDGSYGPRLPGTGGSAHPHGPNIPSVTDLALRDEQAAEAAHSDVSALRHARKLDRQQQKDRLDELVPRADAGTRERKLEKRAALNDKLRAFRDRSPGAADVPEADLLGGGDEGGPDEHRRMVAAQQAKVSERQSRRDEMRRARDAERDERVREYREREERTIETLRELARRRFG